MKLNNTYYILRHGQTIYQTKKKEFAYPRLDSSKIKLTEKGENQIKAVAKKLKKSKGKKFNLIYSSDFFRTKQTAEILAKEFRLKINFDKRLRDINLGIYHQKKKEEYYHDFPKYSKKRFFKAPPKGESWLQCQERMLTFLKEIDKKHKGKIILLISHGDPLWLLEGAIKNLSPRLLLKEKENNYIKVGELRKL